ncbi:uncharacterized protein EI97DRAFT_431820 [Westerdykella ornata]|uniref:VASt domain-containing protein n=1 Tax=Westerdykella ornata TaxID=318751 RepID=A0A6A6JNC8_WESOR|nr:uncharacterized protein EI97DRAFT_431820 [Westerdykella ornata]KAF2277735.1 hypothetical protein EI97DRAFT_431820 [Westerdykella ornata]
MSSRASSLRFGTADGTKESTRAAPSGRRGSKAGLSSTATSIASTDNLARDATSDVRSSIDSTVDKFKGRASEDGKSETSSQRSKLSRLFKKGRRRRKSIAQDEAPEVEAPEEPAPNPIERPSRPSLSLQDSFPSEDSIGLAKSVPSSLLTEDSDESLPVRPGISPHNSHAGYLTLSSPLIASETIDSTVASAANVTDTPASADAPLPLRHAQTIAAANDIKRSASPVSKLKGAFAPQRRSTSPKPGADSETTRPNTSGGGVSALFGGKQKTSRVLDETVPLQASPPQIQDSKHTRSTSDLLASPPKRIINPITTTSSSIDSAPTTFVTPPTPTDANPVSPAEPLGSFRTAAKHAPSQSNPNVVVSPSGNMISHRRARSATNPPSKLSNSFSALSPTLEEVKTPGGTAVQPTGFFSSVLSAAQNAASSLTSTIANTTVGNKNKASNQQPTIDARSEGDIGGEEVIGPENVDPSASNTGPEKRRLAVETLGSGNLSLDQLGITDSAEQSPMSSSVHIPRAADDASAKEEDVAAAQAISAAYAAENNTSHGNRRPRSMTTASAASAALETMSPGRHQAITDSPSASSPVQRTGSIRSRISGGRKRRHRGSSATTGNTIGASTTTLAPPANGQRLNGTGYAVASPKRNREFHNLFKSVPEDDYLIEDYSAALQKEILLQGRLYVSEGHLCFSSNILGWVTNLVISFDEVVSVEKRSTALLFPNGMVIQTLHARNVFASFLSRDATYDLIIGIWKMSHPNLKHSLNGVQLDGNETGDKTEKADSIASDGGSVQDSDDEVYDEDAEEDEGTGSFIEAGDGSMLGSDMGSEKGVESRKTSAAATQAVGTGLGKPFEGAEAGVSSATAGQDFPGPATHSPTDCGDSDQHYDKLLIDTTIPAPLGKIYSLMFGPASGGFMRKWLIEDQKSTELQLEDDKKGLGEDRRTLNYSYIKPLSNGIGPKSTKCNITMTLEQYDLDKAVSVLCSTATPDVPSGNAFLTKTRYCLCWGPANSTRLIMTFTVEWTGKSWLKGPIEKGANDGQLSYATSLAAALRAAVGTKASTRAAGKGKGGRKRSKGQMLEEVEAAAPTTAVPQSTKAREKAWLDSARERLFDPTFLCGLLSLLLVWSLCFRGPVSAHPPYPHTPAQRLAVYEQLWRAEEAELWKWMEERVALDRVYDSMGTKIRQAADMQEKLVEEGMVNRQVDEAIKVTEQRLEALKLAVKREREREPKGPVKSEQENKAY